MNPTFLEFLGLNERSSCGYCKNERGERTPNTSVKENAGGGDSGYAAELNLPEVTEPSVNTGSLWAHSMRPNDYNELLNMGWRRSGRYLYKPDNRLTCCPQYTIRLDVTKFKMSRSQKRVMRQVNEFLETGNRPACKVKEEDAPGETTTTAPRRRYEKPKKEELPKKVKDADRPVLTKKEIRNKRFEEKCHRKNLNPDVVRAERRQKEDARQRTIQSYIDEARPGWKHKLEVKLVHLGSEEFDSKDNESFELYKKYQSTIHKVENSRLAGFRRFLCDSPLSLENREGIDLGSYHMWFLLDGKLIAVCVVDLLTKCLSAKYMYYDPDYSFLSLGTYTALREIGETQRLHNISPSFTYYYMGYYIHSCPKMRYKAKFRPSDLLCDETFKWIEFADCRELLDASTSENGFSQFCFTAERPEDPPINDFLVVSNRVIRTFSQALSQFPQALENERFLSDVRQLAHLVGPDVKNAVYYFKELDYV